MRVLVTGGGGYIGSHTCKALAAAGFEPVTYDNLSLGHRWAVKWGPLVPGELSDSDSVREGICRYGVRAVIHFAASAYVGESMLHPSEYFQNNVVNSLGLLNAMLASGVCFIVFSSSCATYGIPMELPIGESARQFPVSPYGESKLFVERALAWYGHAYGVRSVSLRYFNAADSDPEGELGEMHEPETHLIPKVIAAALDGSSSVQVFGTDYPTVDGTAVRDYVHVSDIAEAHVLALRYLLEGGPSTALNLGTGCGYSVRQVIGAVERITRKKARTQDEPRRPGDVPILVADASLARRLLGWQPNLSSLDAIASSALAWELSQRGRMRQLV